MLVLALKLIFGDALLLLVRTPSLYDCQVLKAKFGTGIRTCYTKTSITSYQWQSMSARAWSDGLLLDHTGLRQVHFYSTQIIRVRLRLITAPKAEIVDDRRAPNANRTPQKGDLIISNWTSYIEILFLVFKYVPLTLFLTLLILDQT